MQIIKAENLGVKFKYSRDKKGTFKKLVANLITDKRVKSAEIFWALRGINFHVNKGEVLGIIGGNGAGKSTLLRLIGGIYVPDEGHLKVKGSISTLLSITAGFQIELTGLENIYLIGILMGFQEKYIEKYISRIIEFSELGDFINIPVKRYSSGMNARLGFSIAVHLRKDIMLIDEILGVGDVKFRQKCGKMLKEIIKGHRTIILVSHSMNAIKEFAHRVIWLEKGEQKAYGPANKVITGYINS